MRAAIIGFAAAVALTTFSSSGQAVPVMPHGFSASAPITLARGGCGPGFHPRRWVDRWGRWHIRCVPNRYW